MQQTEKVALKCVVTDGVDNFIQNSVMCGCNHPHNTSNATAKWHSFAWQSLVTCCLVTHTATLYRVLNGLVAFSGDHTCLPRSTHYTRNTNAHMFIHYSTSSDNLRKRFFPSTFIDWNHLPTCATSHWVLPLLMPSGTLWKEHWPAHICNTVLSVLILL